MAIPAFYIGALGSLLKLEHPLLALALFPLALAGGLALGYGMYRAGKTVAAASTQPVPRWLYGLAGPCFLALAVVASRLAYAQSHASGNAAASITLGFLALYSAVGGVLCLGRAIARGPTRMIFWVFLPQWACPERKPAQRKPRPRRGRKPG
ncbi:MAG TPA: hypothetical protein VEL03_22895 [Streptosporangiaceae bacterium]|nr:hypothetical protein [Streptosporangiaceae bacterium]